MSSLVRTVNFPLKVVWAGWETTTTKLQQAGWEISYNRDAWHNSFQIAIKHGGYKMYGLSDHIDFNFAYFASSSDYYYEHLRHLCIPLKQVSSELIVHCHASRDMNFRPVDAMPVRMEIDGRNIEDFDIFGTPLTRTEEIVVDPKEVGMWLQKIKEAQKPKQKEIIKKARMERQKGMIEDKQVFHAQIISLAE